MIDVDFHRKLIAKLDEMEYDSATDSEYRQYGEFGYFPTPSEIKCECGAEKTDMPGHSSWCPKYDDGKPKPDFTDFEEEVI